MPTLSLIAAMSRNRVIGRENDMPWHISADFKYFKEKTLGKPVITGRKNFEAMGRALPKRENIVITRDMAYHAEGAHVVHTLQDALALANTFVDDEIMVIGGGQIYREALPLADKIYLTEIDMDVDGDVTFPAFEGEGWQEASRIHNPAQEETPAFDFVVYTRSA